MQRREAAERRADQRAGVLASLLFNLNRRKGSRAAEPRHFFPSLGDLPRHVSRRCLAEAAKPDAVPE